MTSVCALIPHYRCEEWLADAIESVLEQTRPPDAIVVIDDCSPLPPMDIVARYPSVTLLAAAENVGPYRLVQEVINRTQFDYYLFQDADDWSAPERLEVLLGEVERTGADLVGSHEVRVLVDEADVRAVAYPLDVNAALAEHPSGFALLHPTSLVSRALVERTGGFATGLRFSGDLELLHRAVHAGRVVNVDRHLYFRRHRTGSLTTSDATGLRSPARLRLRAELAQRADANAARLRRGERPQLAPSPVAGPVALSHLGGPFPSPNAGATAPGGAGSPAVPPHRPPVFVVGAPRSGLALLAWALGQHPRIGPVVEQRWLADVASGLVEAAGTAPAGFHSAFSTAAAAVATGAGGGARLVAAGPELARVAPALAWLFPDARFVHVLRDAGEVVDSLLASPIEGGVLYTAESAAAEWWAANGAADAARQALGPDAVLVVEHRELLAEPEAAVGRVLEFLGEDFARPCLRPFRGMQPPPPSRRTIAPTTSSAPRRPMAELVRALVDANVPAGATVAVASKGDDALVDLGDRRAWHFPQTASGAYAGHHPEDSDAAIAGLDVLQALGARYFLLPASSSWWLDHYRGLADWLGRRCRLVAYQDNAGALWQLGAMSPLRLGAEPASQGVSR